MHSSRFFRIKPIARFILKCKISGSHTISDRSLLLSTIVLNDIYIYIYIYIYVYIYSPYIYIVHKFGALFKDPLIHINVLSLTCTPADRSP